MANQNFRVKKGLEVGLGGTFLYADENGVGINSSTPRVDLDVRGTANIDSLEVGPGTSLVGVGSTFFKVNGDSLIDGDVRITGDLIFDDAIIDDLFVSGIATITELDFRVGIGSTLTVGILSVTEDLTVNGSGIATLGGDPEFNSLSVTGFSTFGGLNTTGFSTFYQNVEITEDLIADNVSVANSVTTDELRYNVGVGTSLTLEDLFVTGEIDVNGTGIATIGGDPLFNTLTVLGISTFGGLATTGFTTFYSNVRIEEDLQVAGNIELLDLEAGNITVGGTVTTNGIDFNTGIGTELVVGFSSVGILTANTLDVAVGATFGGINTTGFSTFYQNLRVEQDLVVAGDIQLEDLESGNISVGGTVTTNGLKFNVGIGTSLTITGISSLGVITGIGSELQFLPAGSISTSVGVGSTVPPSTRPTGEPVQPGDLWFDSLGLRQYTYYVGLNSLGNFEGQWLDSNPPPIQPALRFSADQGVVGSIDIQNDIFDFNGTPDQIVTKNSDIIIGSGQTITFGLTTSITVEENIIAGQALVGAAASITGVGTFNSVVATTASLGIVDIDDLTSDEATLGEVGIDTVRFNVGFGTTLTVTDLEVTGIASLSGSGIATLGGVANFESIVAGVTTLGLTTITSDLYVAGDLYVGDDLTFDAASLRIIDVSEEANIEEVNFNVGIGTTLLLAGNLSVGSTVNVTGAARFDDTVRVENNLTVVSGVGSFQQGIEVGSNIDLGGNLSTPSGNVEARNVTSTNQLSFSNASGENLSVNGTASMLEVGFTTATGNRVFLDTEFQNTGVSSFVGTIGFGTANGYELNVDRLLVPSNGFVDLPGIPVVGGAASFSQLNVTGLATFIGFTTFVGDVRVSGAMTVGSLTADQINFSGGTGIGSDFISTNDLSVSGISTLQDLNVLGISTFVGLGTFKDDLFVSEDLFVERNATVGGAVTVGLLTATNVFADNLTVTGTLSAEVGGQLLVQGDTVIDGVVTIGSNSITLDGRAGREFIELGTGSGVKVAGLNTITGERSHVAVDEGRFTNFISVAGVGSTSTFANDVTIGGDLVVDGDIEFSGGTGINSTSITTDEINAGFLNATNATVAGIITAQDFNSLSDRRVKENVEPIEKPLDKVSKLNGVTYQFVNSGKPSVGVIAQEVEKVFPELISGTFPKSVNYNGLVGLLIESVKELKVQNEELKRRLDKLEG